MLVGTLVAIAGAWAASRAMGGTPEQANAAAIALGAGSLLSFAPALIRIGADHWGVAVLLAGVGRALLVAAICYFIKENNPDLMGRPLFIPALGAAIFLLTLETALAVRILSKIEQQKAELKAAGIPAAHD